MHTHTPQQPYNHVSSPTAVHCTRTCWLVYGLFCSFMYARIAPPSSPFFNGAARPASFVLPLPFALPLPLPAFAFAFAFAFDFSAAPTPPAPFFVGFFLAPAADAVVAVVAVVAEMTEEAEEEEEREEEEDEEDEEVWAWPPPWDIVTVLGPTF